MKFSLRDLMWLTLSVALAIALVVSSIHNSKLLTKNESMSKELESLRAEIKKQNVQIASARTRNIDLGRIAKSKEAGDFFVYRGLELQKQNRHAEAAASFVIAAEKHPRNLFIINKIVECFERTDFDDKLNHWTNIRDELVHDIQKTP